MDLITTAAIAHKLVKNQHEIGTLQLRDTCLPSSTALDRLIGEIQTAYAEKSGKSHGVFEEDETNYPTAANLRQHFQAESANFVDTSHALMKTLLTRANEASSNLATGGSVLIADINDGSTRWLLIAILTDKLGAKIDDHLDLDEVVYLDLGGMRFAGRVNITKWLNSEERHISFLRGGAQQVSDYFQRFLGCTQPTAWQQETKQLVDTVRLAVNSLDCTDQEREAAQQRVYQYLDDCARTAEPLSIDSLCNQAWPDGPNLLRTQLNDPETGISDDFVPHRRTLKGLVSFEGKTKNWQVKFEREAVTSGDISLTATDDLLIKNVPANILAKFKSDFPASE